MNKLYVGLLLSMSSFCTQVKPYFTFIQEKASTQAKKDTLLKAIDNLQVAQVEHEIKEHGVFEQSYKLRLADAIEEKITILKKEQSSLHRYLNPQLALGALATGLASGYFNASTLDINDIARTTYLELARRFNRAAPRLITHEEYRRLSDTYAEKYNKTMWMKGATIGAISMALAAVGLKQLYNGLTTKELKDNYQKALAIKMLIQQAPTE